MRPPYLLCRHHCPHFERCREVLEIFERAEEEGEPHPLSMLLREGCPMFRMPSLPNQVVDSARLQMP